MSYCKACSAERTQAWAAANPERVRADYNPAKNRFKLYGITGEEYDAMVVAQKGVCLACQRQCYKALSVDHCHQTGKVRGLLCDRCNRGIGFLDECPTRLRRLADYLERHKAG